MNKQRKYVSYSVRNTKYLIIYLYLVLFYLFFKGVGCLDKNYSKFIFFWSDAELLSQISIIFVYKSAQYISWDVHCTTVVHWSSYRHRSTSWYVGNVGQISRRLWWRGCVYTTVHCISCCEDQKGHRCLHPVYMNAFNLDFIIFTIIFWDLKVYFTVKLIDFCDKERFSP